MTEDPTLEETLNGFLHDRTPGSVLGLIEIGVTLLELLPIVVQTPVEGGLLRMVGPVGSRPEHSLPETNASSNLRGQYRHSLRNQPPRGVEAIGAGGEGKTDAREKSECPLLGEKPFNCDQSDAVCKIGRRLSHDHDCQHQQQRRRDSLPHSWLKSPQGLAQRAESAAFPYSFRVRVSSALGWWP